ncbi:MAG: hypothetical protein RLZZ387_3793 [Chloroflexota bacterium]
MFYSSRPYADESDYARMRGLLITAEALAGPAVYFHLGDLDWWRFTELDPNAAIAEARLWHDSSGQLVAFGLPKGDQIDIIAHPGHPDAEEEVLAWAEDRIRVTGGTSSLTAWSYEGDARRVALLERRGYERGTMSFLCNAQDLEALPPPAALPEGYRIRHVRGDEDVAARVEVHRDAFAPSRMTVAKHRAVMAAPSYRPELDLVVEAPDGSFAAFALLWYDEANRCGEFEPVGCHSSHRRLGLTRELLLEGMRRLRALGATSASVFSSGEERYAPSRHLYSSAGFTIVDRMWSWERLLPR